MAALTISSEIDEKIVHLMLKNKQPNVAGMQLADLVATAVGRSVIAKPAHGNEVSRDVVMRKIRRVSGVYEGHGLVVRPRSGAKSERPGTAWQYPHGFNDSPRACDLPASATANVAAPARVE
jgi:hypothetical protein